MTTDWGGGEWSWAGYGQPERGRFGLGMPSPTPPAPSWVIRPGEVKEPPKIMGQKDMRMLELSARGVTRQQFLQLIQDRIKRTPPDIMAEYQSQAQRYVDLGFITDPNDYIYVELADVVGVRDLELDSPFAHEVTNRIFGQRKIPGQKEYYEGKVPLSEQYSFLRR